MLTVAGVGPGNPKYLTYEVKERIDKVDYILAFGRVADSLKNIRKDIVKINRVEEAMDYIDKKREVLLLASGDPNFYGIVDYLKRKNVNITQVLPGISSFQYMMCKLQKPWQNASFVSLHGRNEDLEIIKSNQLTVLLIDKINKPSIISKKLEQKGMKGKIHIGFNLSYENEVIITKNIGADIEDISSLGVVIIEKKMD